VANPTSLINLPSEALGRRSMMSAVELPDPIDRFVDAVNRGDNEAFLAFFPKDGVVVDSGRRFAGHKAILGWSDREFIGAKGRISSRTSVAAATKLALLPTG
jgi:hypothetical protein